MNLLLVALTATALVSEAPTVARPSLGPDYAVPERARAEGAPLVYSFTPDAGPDQSFLLVGEGFGKELTAWGVHPDAAGGREIRPKVQMSTAGLMMATLPERAYQGPIVVWAKNQAGYSEPVVLNAPQPWWCLPENAEPGSSVDIFGRNLSLPPSFSRAFVYLALPGKEDWGVSGRGGVWLNVEQVGKYRLKVELPRNVGPGRYHLWVYAGVGGKFGRGGPVEVSIEEPRPRPLRSAVADTHRDLQQAVDELASQGGGTLSLPEGTIPLSGTLVLPANVRIQGAGQDRTILVSPRDPAARLANVVGSTWNQGPGAVHTPGDRMVYRVAFPAAGQWTVWLRYATEMSAYKLPGVSKQMTLGVDDGEPVPLDNLPNTGSFGTFKWSKSAVLNVPAGRHDLVWRNVKGGGIHIDAFVFSLDPEAVPSDNPMPERGPKLVVVQGEDVFRFETKEGMLPGGDRAAVWLAGDRAAVSRLTIQGSSRTNLGIVVRSPRYPLWIRGCEVSQVKVCDNEGKQAENCGIRLFNADGALVQANELWGRTPIFLSGVQRSRITGNRLVSLTLWGGNSESYILGRNDVVRKCVIENNVCACPTGAEAGGPTGRRLIWLSTGRGSVALNWLAGNREDRARFGGVAGTDQNVGEMILFEACERIAYHGPAAAAGARSVTLPAKLPPTPDDRLGSVRRDQLAHDAEGNETPFWPPDVDQGTREPTVSEYYVTVLRGRGLGQTRRVEKRQGETYQLDRPWRVVPEAGALILVHTAYYRNHIVGNRTVDGMTGIQLWISCIENVISGNEVLGMRKPGLYLYGNCTTLASSMPTTWNRGIGPLYFNHIEGTRCDETSCGALVVSGEMHHLPVEFPRCLGNVLRHNSFLRNRTDGLLIAGNRPAGEQQPAAVVQGTIAEFNVARDANVAYHVARSAEATLLRRNHAYFWYPVNLDPGPPTAFQIDDENASAAMEQNSVEGIHGTYDGRIVIEQRGPKKPAK